MPDDQRPPGRNLIPAPMGLRPQTFAELEKLATWFANSTAVPKEYQGRPENCFVAIQMGSELGLAPMQSLQNIAVIGGRPAVFGDAMLGLCLQSPLCIGVTERTEGAGDTMVAICTAKRNGAEQPIERRFSVHDAQTAKLWGKAGPWTDYPPRMLQLRARSFCLRDAFPDVLRGLAMTEELRDTFDGTTIEGTAEPIPPTPPPPPQPPPAAPTPPAPKPPPPPPTQPATAAATNGAGNKARNGSKPANGNGGGDKWKASLETALGTMKTLTDIDAFERGTKFVEWRTKASPEQEAEIARLIAAKRTQVTPPATDWNAPDLTATVDPLSPATVAALAKVAAIPDLATLNALYTDTAWNVLLVGLPSHEEQERVSEAMKRRATELEAG